ncbi:hypothetical protein NBRC116584_29640 [Hydrogenophaga sp. 5NK40-0174]
MQLTFARGAVFPDLAAPSKPQAARRLKCLPHRYGETAGGGFSGIGDSIGYDDESTHVVGFLLEVFGGVLAIGSG